MECLPVRETANRICARHWARIFQGDLLIALRARMRLAGEWEILAILRSLNQADIKAVVDESGDEGEYRYALFRARNEAANAMVEEMRLHLEWFARRGLTVRAASSL